jgi:hypothetical protein
VAWPQVVERPTLLGAAAVRRQVHLAMQREELVWVGPPLELLEAVAWRVWPRAISSREREGVVADDWLMIECGRDQWCFHVWGDASSPQADLQSKAGPLAGQRR